jgi:hypothetical protein
MGALKQIYKASDCMDINDTLTAIDLTKKAILENPSRAAYRRLISLERKLEKLRSLSLKVTQAVIR